MVLMRGHRTSCTVGDDEFELSHVFLGALAGSGGFTGFGAVPVPSRSQLSQARVGALAAVGPPRCPPRRGPKIRPRRLSC
ncbi:hypothetical protein C9424_08065 [Arthrobacter sp. H-02-3]|nr:hypothetical protein C9424_08065 [Arthrobacter sp. H-02-3]